MISCGKINDSCTGWEVLSMVFGECKAVEKLILSKALKCLFLPPSLWPLMFCYLSLPLLIWLVGTFKLSVVKQILTQSNPVFFKSLCFAILSTYNSPLFLWLLLLLLDVFEATPNGGHDRLLALSSGISFENAQGTIWNAGDWPWYYCSGPNPCNLSLARLKKINLQLFYFENSFTWKLFK